MGEDEARFAGFEAEGEATVRERIKMGREGVYNERNRALAIVWLSRIDQAREAASAARTEAYNSELAALQRRTAEATEVAAAAALASAKEAAAANEIARAANELASSANTLASRANNRARDANKIAVAAAFMAVVTAVFVMFAEILRAH